MNILQKLIVLIFYLVIIQVLFGCSRNREVIFTGFAYQDEKVEVSYKENILSPFDFRTHNSKTGLQFFHEKRMLKGSQLRVKVIIDSAGKRLLDSLILIPDSYKIPLISFVDPSDTIPKRELFLTDSDEMIKY